MKKFDTLVVGELNVDLILNKIESFPEIGKEKLADEMTLTLGSSAAIFASNLSSLGAKTAFLGKIGKDSFGDLVISSLKEKGVDTDFIGVDESAKTGATIILNFDEDRAMVTHAGAMENLTVGEITDEQLNTAKHMHVSSIFLQPGLKKNITDLFKRAKRLGLTTSLDPQWDPAEKWNLELDKLLPYVDVFLPNEQEIIHLTNEINYEKAVQKILEYANVIVVKRGNKGSVVYHKNLLSNITAFLNTNVVDAIGAGDSFDAGFIFKYVNGELLENCQRFGNITGAVNTTAAGGTTAFKNYETVLKIAKSQFGIDEV
jgi:sugar/nucleoside kinase (ribokinase family)